MSTEEIKEYIGTQLKALTSIASPTGFTKNATDYLMKQLEAHFGCRLQPKVEIDSSLIGGVRVAVGDQILDASVRGKLDAMAAALKN